MTERARNSSSDTDSSRADGAVRAQYEWSSTTPSTAVVETVAVAANCEPEALDPLYNYIDPDALDVIIRSRKSSSTGDDATVSFVFDGQRITVHSSGEVVVRTGDSTD